MLSLVRLSPQCSQETDLGKMLGHRDTCAIEEKDTSLLVPSRAGAHGSKSPPGPALPPVDERRLTGRGRGGVGEAGSELSPSAGRLSLGSPPGIVCM